MTPLVLNIRPAVPDDHMAIIRLLDTLSAEEHARDPVHFVDRATGFSAAEFDDLLNRSHELHLAAEVNGTVIGYLRAWRFQLGAGSGISVIRPRLAVHIQVIVVAPASRRHGVGRALFAAVEHWARACKVELIGLNVSQGNNGARAFYAPLGFSASTTYLVKDLSLA
jgi:ribosomal protein S18 acetylase RimI-like enzyme